MEAVDCKMHQDIFILSSFKIQDPSRLGLQVDSRTLIQQRTEIGDVLKQSSLGGRERRLGARLGHNGV